MARGSRRWSWPRWCRRGSRRSRAWGHRARRRWLRLHGRTLMLLVGVMAAVLWGIGAAMGTPRRLRWGMIAGLWAGVTLAHLVLPAGHPIRVATGGEAALWLMLGGAAALVLVYRAGLGRLRARAGAREAEAAQAAEAQAPKPLFSQS